MTLLGKLRPQYLLADDRMGRECDSKPDNLAPALYSPKGAALCKYSGFCEVIPGLSYSSISTVMKLSPSSLLPKKQDLKGVPEKFRRQVFGLPFISYKLQLIDFVFATLLHTQNPSEFRYAL